MKAKEALGTKTCARTAAVFQTGQQTTWPAPILLAQARGLAERSRRDSKPGIRFRPTRDVKCPQRYPNSAAGWKAAHPIVGGHRLQQLRGAPSLLPKQSPEDLTTSNLHVPPNAKGKGQSLATPLHPPCETQFFKLSPEMATTARPRRTPEPPEPLPLLS